MALNTFKKPAPSWFCYIIRYSAYVDGVNCRQEQLYGMWHASQGKSDRVIHVLRRSNESAKKYISHQL